MTGRASAPARYALALSLAAASVAVRLPLDPWLGTERLALSTALAGVVLAAWVAGLGPALVTLVAAALLDAVLVLPPRGSVRVEHVEDQVALGLYAVLALGCAFVGASARRAQLRALAAAELARSREVAMEREAAERRRAEQLLEAVLDQAPIGLGLVGVDGRYAFRNPVLARWTGDRLPSLEELGGAWRAFGASGEPLPLHEWPGARALRGETVAPGIDFVHRTPDGTETWLRVSAAPLRDDAARTVGAVTLVQDIDALKRSEEALQRQSELTRLRVAELESLLAAVPAPIWIAHDPACSQVTGNSLANHLLGVEPGTNVSATGPTHHFTALRDGKVLPADELPLRRAVLTGQPVLEDEMDFVPREGRPVRMLANAVPVKDASGAVRGAVAVCLDITARKQVEAELRARSEQLRTLADVALRLSGAREIPEVLERVTDEARRLVEAHQGVTSLVQDGDWSRAVHARSLSAKYDRWRDEPVAPSGAGMAAEVCGGNRTIRMTQAEVEAHPGFRVSDALAGTRPPLRGWLAAPLVGRDGRNLGVVQLSDKEHGEFTAEDEAILVQLAQMASVAVENVGLVADLRAADQRKDEFLATLAHELRNPLAPVRNAVYVLGRRAGGDPTTERARVIIERQVGHMVRLIDDLLDVSRISRGKLELRRERIDLGHAIRQAIEACEPALVAAGHTVDVRLPPEPIALEADSVRLVQILGNLLSNATKFSDPGGRIVLSVRRGRGEVAISVADRGVGIPPDRLDGIFDMFSQVESTLDRTRGGLGIGLTLVQRLVELHGGRVEARSEGLGHGAEFVVHLPVLPAPERSPAPSVHDAAVTPAVRRVLVVDDNRDGAEMLAGLLELEGVTVAVAHDGPEALRRAGAFAPDLVLLDIGLPGMNGYEVCTALRSEPWGRPMRVVALTGWGQEDDRRRSREAGFDAHLVKPIGLDELRGILADAAGRDAPATSSAWN